ncbi:MAG: hypothetical protein HRT86_08650 [Ilumatobacteraceae bacterium]|nr:hypothetical protein [Ilumatobacteraceae bacterium]
MSTTPPDVDGSGTPDDPWILLTPSGKSEFEAYRDPATDPPAVVVQVGATELRYHLDCIDDLHSMLTDHGDSMLLGNADEQKEAKPDTVEAWGRSSDNPVGGCTASRSADPVRDSCARPSPRRVMLARTCRPASAGRRRPRPAGES